MYRTAPAELCNHGSGMTDEVAMFASNEVDHFST
jgi:hypothetical protein